MAEYIKIYPQNPNPRAIRRVVDVLKRGGLVIYPTDTVYGLGCNLMDHKAVERLARLKGVKPDRADFSFICHDLSHLSDYAKQIDTPTFKVLRRTLPGPYTFILKGARTLPNSFKKRKTTSLLTEFLLLDITNLPCLLFFFGSSISKTV